MLLINTRPADRARPLTECFEQAHFDVLELPVLALKPCVLDESLQQLFQQLREAKIVVVVSPMAVQVGMSYLQQCEISLAELSHLQWVAVGQTTSDALAEFGIVSHVPEVETSEGMLSLSVFNTLESQQCIAFWRGEGGRQFMMQACQRQNHKVLNFLLYQREFPEHTQQKFEQAVDFISQAEKPYWVCISSEASWKNWLTMTSKHHEIQKACHFLVLGERLYQLLLNDPSRQNIDFAVTQLDRLSPETVLHQVNELKRSV